MMSTDSAAQELFKKFWEWRLKESPEFATLIGNHEYNDQLDSYTLLSFEKRINACKIFVADAVQIMSEDNLDENTRLNLNLFIAQLNSYLKGMEAKGYFFCITYLDGIQLNLLDLIKRMVFQMPDDYEKLILRLKAVPQQILEIIDIMREGVLRNMTLHEVSMKGILKQLDCLNVDIEESPFFEAFLNIPLCFSESEKVTIQNMARIVLMDEVFPSFACLRNFLRYEYFQHLRPNVSICSVPNGTDFYLKCLKFYLGFNVTPQEVHNLGLIEVNRIKEEIERLIESLELNMSVEEFKTRLRDDKAFYFQSQEEGLEAYNGLRYNKVRPKLQEVIHPLPKLELSIPPSLSYMTHGPACYFHGTPVGHRPYMSYVNSQQLEACATYELMAFALHKAEPGHHLQFCYMMETKDTPDFRRYIEEGNYSCTPSRFQSNTAFIEGWGMYSEYLGYELKMYEDPYFEYGHLSHEIFRACCLVVDTGIHALGWSREKAIKYMLENTALRQDKIESEVNRYITWPGQACAYKIGELKIRQLRKKAEISLRDKFDLRSFHDVVLRSVGPLSFLERNVDIYIYKQTYEISDSEF